MDINFIFYLTMILMVLLMFAVIFAIIKGPTMIDRVLAANVIGTMVVSLIVLVGVVLEKLDMYIDLALTYALLNFLTSLVAGRFLKHVAKANNE